MGENPPEALTQSEAGAYFLLETLNCHRRLWLGRLSHLHQRWGGRVAPLFAHYSHTQNPLLVLLPAAGPVHTRTRKQGKKSRGRAPLPLTTPKRKRLRHSHGYREAGEATNRPKAMERAQKPFSAFNFPGPSRYTHHKPKKSNPESPEPRLPLRQLCPM